ncbi:MAG: MGMT family protein, partial [Dethiobacteria bacterium]
ELQRYLKGQQPAWDDYPLDMSGYPPFTRSLLSAVRRIPYGETRSYREVAAEAGSPRAWRAAGQALKANRHPLLVPCHRVIRSDGRPGGFSGPPGWKEMLLHLELVN